MRRIIQSHLAAIQTSKCRCKEHVCQCLCDNVSERADSLVLEELVDEEDEAVLTDSAYQSESSETFLLEKNCQNFIVLKAARNHPLNDEETLTYKMRSRIHVRCLYVFRRISQIAMD